MTTFVFLTAPVSRQLLSPGSSCLVTANVLLTAPVSLDCFFLLATPVSVTAYVFLTAHVSRPLLSSGSFSLVTAYVFQITRASIAYFSWKFLPHDLFCVPDNSCVSTALSPGCSCLVTSYVFLTAPVSRQLLLLAAPVSRQLHSLDSSCLTTAYAFLTFPVL
jgi:hypothetical protein